MVRGRTVQSSLNPKFLSLYLVWYPFAGSGWKWSNFYPYMKKAENTLAPPASNPFNDPASVDTPFQGSGGPIFVSRSTNNHFPLLPKCLEILQHLLL